MTIDNEYLLRKTEDFIEEVVPEVAAPKMKAKRLLELESIKYIIDLEILKQRIEIYHG